MTYCQKRILTVFFIFIYLIRISSAESRNLESSTKRKSLDPVDELLSQSSKCNKENEFGDEEDYENSNNDYEGFISGTIRNQRKLQREGDKKGPKLWDRWGRWAPCSVTCGIGKITRWRHCVSGSCATGEKEAQIKTCTLPAC